MIGQTISHYRITEKLGEGGMGIVYKAEDTRLDRAVALKFLAAHLLRDEEVQKRFHREAKAAAALDHPNICGIYEIDEAGGRTFLALPYLDGRPLSRRIAEGPLKITEALSVAVQVAEGLDAAHQKGVIHRDIKPDNLMLVGGSRGVVKILDFGLANFRGGSKLTRAGTTLGTANYMSPEQAEGGAADHRSDYWSLGVVLYEMVAGKPPFQAENDQALLYAILHHSPEPLSAVRTGVPRELDRVVAKLMAKKPEQRYQHAADLLVDLDGLRRESPAPPPSRPRGSKRWLIGAAAGALAAAGGLGLWLGRPPAAPAGPPQYQLAQLTRNSGYSGGPAISPDGRLIAYASDRAGNGNLDLWVQQVAGGDPIRLTSDADAEYSPAFSPDGSQIVFQSDTAGGGVHVIPALGGAVRRVAELGVAPRFSPDGRWISFVRQRFQKGNELTGSVHLVPAAGGPEQTPRFSLTHVARVLWSPDAKSLLLFGSMQTDGFGILPNREWWLAPAEGGEAIPLGAREVLAKAGITDPFLSGPRDWVGDRIFFEARVGGGPSNLWSVAVQDRRLTGELARLTNGTGEFAPSVALDGRIAFESGTGNLDIWALPIDANAGKARGPIVPTITSLAVERYATVSKDGSKLMYVSGRAGHMDVWLRELSTGKDIPITAGPAIEPRAAISPDGSRAAFVRQEDRRLDLYLIDLAARIEKKVAEGVGNLSDWTPDGKRLLYYTTPPLRWRWMNPDTGESGDIGIEHPRHPIHDLRFSPDMRWASFKLFVDAPRYGPMYVAAIKDGRPAPENEWIPVGDPLLNGRNWWAPDGARLYWTSRRDGHWCIWTQRLNPATKQPIGEIEPVQHLHDRLSADPRDFGYAMTADRLYLPVGEHQANIWLATPQK